MGELVRRVDPAHRTLGRFFAEEIAEPLELDVYFGLPEDVPKRRVARIERAAIRSLPGLRDLPPRMALAMANPRSVSFKAFANPRMRTPAALDSRRFRTWSSPLAGRSAPRAASPGPTRRSPSRPARAGDTAPRRWPS